MNKRCLIILFFTGLLSEHLKAQSFAFRYYNEENGLAHNYIYAISQSEKGHLLLSAGEAFYRYDGRNFLRFTNEHFRQNFVTTHFVDSRDIVWIGHNQNGISSISGDKIMHLTHAGMASAKVTGFHESKRNIYVSTRGAGIFVVDTARSPEPVRCGGITNVNGICGIDSITMLIGTPEGLLLAEMKAFNDLSVNEKIVALEGIPVKQVVKGREPGVVWVLTDFDGFFRLTFNGTQLAGTEHFRYGSGSTNAAGSITEDRAGNIWLSIPGEGVRKLSFINVRGKKQIREKSFGPQNGLRSLHIQSVFEDQEGNMWFGSFGEGLIQKLKQRYSFYGDAQGLKSRDVREVLSDTSGNLYLGTSEGLYYFDLTTRKTTPIAPGVLKNVSALLFDQYNGLWVGTERGLFYKAPRTSRFIDCFAGFQIAPSAVNTILIKEDHILCATTQGIFETKTDLSEMQYLTTNEGLLHNNIIHLFRDSRDRIWVSSHGTPVYYIHKGKIKAFKDLSGRTSFNFNVVFEDRNGNIWIGTEGDGVFRYDGVRFHHFGREQGLLSDYCTGITQDAAGSLWVTHRSGLSEKSRYAEFFTPVNERSGLIYYENNHDAAHADGQGNLWFGTAQGLVHYDAGGGKGENYRPRVYINELKFNNQSFPVTGESRLRYGNYAVRIGFSAISFSHQQDIIYRYRLLGADSAWKETEMPYLDIPRLNDGEYRFEVLACLAHSGACSKIPAVVTFSIDAPLWKKVWFYLVAAAILFTGTYIIIRIRTQRLRSMQHLLQLKVKQKTFLLQREKEAVEKIKGELEKRNKDITDSINYAKNIQDSILPPDEMLEELFGRNYFVLYEPKDIVSGDLYWAAALNVNNNNKKDLSLAAVIDCTGHGVPGAFLSIMANDFLKQSIISRNVNSTDEILNFLNEEVSSHLNQSQSKRMKDGMDIALVGIDAENLTLYFSGANNPAYIYRQSATGTQTFMLKGTKQAIGQGEGEYTRYDEQVFDLEEGDTIYLFSDGFADQFGGTMDKKLTYRRFREILEQASLLPMSDQKQFILEHFQRWKGENEQTDDVCVMGIRVVRRGGKPPLEGRDH